MHRFFIPPDQIDENQAVLMDAAAHQICKVLRMEMGQHIVVLDNFGYEYELELAHVERKQVIGKVIEKRPSANEPTTQITLFQSLLKRDKFELILQKVTEIGVTQIVPIVTQRSLIQTTEMKANKQSRWQRILAEAAEQSRRGRIPKLHPPMKFEEAVKQVSDYQLSLIAFEGGGVTIKTAVSNMQPPKKIALFIGSEGGFTDNEIQLAQHHGVTAITLGSRILRAETAALVAPALILHELEGG